jgi:hypothetical protein
MTFELQIAQLSEQDTHKSEDTKKPDKQLVHFWSESLHTRQLVGHAFLQSLLSMRYPDTHNVQTVSEFALFLLHTEHKFGHA